MKLAYLAYDKTCLKALPYLKNIFTEVDFYIQNENQEALDFNLQNCDIWTDHLYISCKQENHTEYQKEILKEVSLKLNSLSNSVYHPPLKTFDNTITSRDLKVPINIFDFQSIKKINYTKNKVYNVLLNETEINYSHVVFQNHIKNTENILSKQQNIIKKNTSQKSILLQLVFSIKSKLNTEHLAQKFILINNSNVDTFFDNWFFCKMSEGQIFVNFLFHETESKSHDFLKFITERVKKILVSKLTLFEINELVKRNLICIDQFAEMDSYFLENKTLHQVPSFTYWSDEQVNNYLTHMFKSAKVINPKGAV